MKRKEVYRMLSIISAGVAYLRHRFPREDGAVATEYGLLLVLIALVIAAGATALGLTLLGVFNDADASLGGATAS
jgi:Flp pilus assembly pilin Flp